MVAQRSIRPSDEQDVVTAATVEQRLRDRRQGGAAPRPGRACDEKVPSLHVWGPRPGLRPGRGGHQPDLHGQRPTDDVTNRRSAWASHHRGKWAVPPGPCRGGKGLGPPPAGHDGRGPVIGRRDLHLAAVSHAHPATGRWVRREVRRPQPGQGRFERVDPTEEQDRPAEARPPGLEQRASARDDATDPRRAAVTQHGEESLEHRIEPCRVGRLRELVPAVDHDERLPGGRRTPGPRHLPPTPIPWLAPLPREVLEVVDERGEPASVARRDHGSDVGQCREVSHCAGGIDDVDVDLGGWTPGDRGEHESARSGRTP